MIPGARTRLLQSFETPLLLPLGELFWRESGQARPFNASAFTATFSKGIRAGTRFVIVAEVGGLVVAGIAMAIGTSDFTGESVAIEAFFYAAKAHRGSFGNLIAEAEAEAIRRGAKSVWMIHMENQRAEVMAKWYGRLGYIPRERLYEKAL